MSWQEDKAHLDDIKFVAVKKVEEEQFYEKNNVL